ncbi:SDR family NAD(P)-dependent oxidoreductase [Nocardia coubleae]|uniref:SDR family NAD(P)-dependent oxidoreductase n=1 Tax=Nocardia coubleae TaxID=356147 RepID=A0A846W8C7_9NOCA|nr:SDR family NAD(P)-dependent oxidoreductase [Nocardia coubleae]NKX88698.1 SDR family NAD(P)-dependent oxidoreductase [Nocardia coubleae]
MNNPVTKVLLNPAPSAKSVLGAALSGPVDLSGKVVVLTGASSGIGETTAHLLASHGAHIVAVARDRERLDQVCADIAAAGGSAHAVPCDMTDADQVGALATTVLDLFGVPDIIINNAGRSIRRTALDAAERAHDYERTMAVNYFGPVRLTLAMLPALRLVNRGHIINIGTWGTTAGVMPKFSAYHASKAALAAFGRSVGAECHGTGIKVTTIGFPLVRTPMISPTAEYDSQAALTPDQAAQWVLTAVRDQPVELYPVYAGVLRLMSALSPRLTDAVVRAAGI